MKNDNQEISEETIFTNASRMVVWQRGIINLSVLYTMGQCSGHSFDCQDITILTWFAEFSQSGKMRQNHLYSKKDNKYYDDFFFVNYEGIITQNPLLKIDSRRTIARRFERYCKTGILDFCLVTSGGCFTNYRFSNPHKELLLSHDVQAFRKVPELYGLKWDVQNVDAKIQPTEFQNPIPCTFTCTDMDEEVHTNNSVVNDFTVKDSPVITSLSNKENKKYKNEINKILFSLFEKRAANFTKDFPDKILSVFDAKGIGKDRLYGYLNFVLECTKKRVKDDTKTLSYFYKCAVNQRTAENYLANQKPFYDEKPLPEELESIW